MSDEKPTRQRRKQARPGEIVAAALASFHKKGFAASKIEDIATAANVTKGTVYLYFQNKEDLFKASIRQTITPGIDRLESIALSSASATESLRHVLRQWASGLACCRGSLTKLMIAEAGNFPELAAFYQEEVSLRMRRLLARIIEKGIADGEFTPCKTSSVARVLTAPVLMSNIWQHTFSEPQDSAYDPIAMAENTLEIVLNGITPSSKEETKR